MPRPFRSFARSARLAAALVLCVAAPAGAQGTNTLPADLAAKVNAAIANVMKATQVPSASVGIVRDGRIVYTAAFGKARIAPPLAASPAMHYAVGSISKQFTVAAVMLLVEEGKLSLDDPVSKWFPELTRANEVTLRNLMSHTSGYEDYAPQDYTIPAWTRPTTAQAIVHEWATKPLDFDPGTQYQYSNTNFNIVGLIVEKASGQPFWTFLSSRVLQPLGLAHTIDLDTQHEQMEPTGYFRHALGPLRPALTEAPGWYFADGEIAMPVGDLLTWDISVMNQTLLRPSSYTAMETEMMLRNGKGAGYALGLRVGAVNGHRMLTHGGEVGGFVASNTVFPDDKIAVAVLTNQEASPAAGAISRAITALLLPATASSPDAGAVHTNQDARPAAGAISRAITALLLPATASSPDAGAASAEALARKVLAGLQHGKIDRALFTANANFYFDKTAIGDFASSLGPLGAIKSLRQTGTSLRGGMTYRGFAVEFANGTNVTVSTYTTSAGLYEQFLVAPAST